MNVAIPHSCCADRGAARPLSDTDRWGRWFLLASIAVWPVSIGIGFAGAVALVTAFSMLAIAVGFFEPRLGMLGFGMALTLDAVNRLYLAKGGFFRFNTLNYCLIVATLGFLPLLLVRIDVHTRLLLGLTLLLGLGVLISPAPELGRQHVLALVSVFGIIVCFSRCTSDARTWLWMGLINGALSAAGGLALYATKANQGKDPNIWSYFPLAGLLSACISFPLAREGSKTRAALGAFAATNAIWVFISGSRGTFFLAAISLVYLVWNIRGLALRLSFLAGCCLLIVLASAESEANTFTRLRKLFDSEYSVAESTSGRSTLFAAGWDVFRKNPLGAGTGAYAVETAQIAAESFSAGQPMQAHSAWVKTLAENGVLGTLLLAAYVF